MKRVFMFLSLAIGLTAARADLVLQQNIESAMMNGTVTTQIKGNRIRLDMPPSPQGTMSTIMDLNSGDSVTLLHQQKMAMKVPGAEIKQMAQNMKARSGGTNTPAVFHDTGKTEKVNNYDAEIYNWSSPDGANQTVWVAKNYPNYSRIKAEMNKLNESPIAQLSKGSAPDISSLPGMVVKTQTEMNGQKVTSTLVSVKEQPVDASVFETPKGYQEMTPPAGGPAPTQ